MRSFSREGILQVATGKRHREEVINSVEELTLSQWTTNYFGNR